MTYTNKHFDEILQAKRMPATHGEFTAIRAYIDCQHREESEYIIREMGFAHELPDFMAAIQAAGITEFIIADASTALMEILNILMNNGWTAAGTYEHDDKYCKVFGLRMRKAA